MNNFTSGWEKVGDVYEVDASQAQTQLAALRAATRGYAQDVGEELTGSFTKMFSATAAAQLVTDAFKASMRAAVDVLKESVHAAMEAQQVDMRLSVALKNAGYDAQKYSEILGKQATALEELTGKDDEYYKQLQTTLLTMGVAPDQINKFTKAALDLAAATGQDATNAARLLARAHAEGKDELKKYGISVDEAAFAARGFNAVIDEVNRKFGGLHAEIPQQQKDINSIRASWEQFKETLGGVVLNLTNISGLKSAMKEAIDTMKEWITPQAAKMTRQQMMDEMANIEKALSNGNFGASGPGVATFEQMQARYLELQKMLVEPQWVKDVAGIGDRKPEKKPLTDEQKAAQKKALEDLKKYNEDKEKLMLLSHANLQKMDEEEEARVRKAIEEHADIEKMFNEQSIEAAQQKAADEIAIMKDVEDKRRETEDKRREREKAFYDGLLNDLANYGRQVLDYVGSIVEQQLTQNKAYNEAYHKAMVERRLMDAEEAGAKKTKAEVEKEMGQEAMAAEQKQLAAFLASIAKEAGIRAIVEGAEAIASLAKYDYPGAAQHGAAAAAFAGVALLAGGSAAAISGARGMTAEEKANIENLNKRDTERKEREAKATTAAADAPIQQNVYFFGISGFSDIQQQAVLDEKRRALANLSTGSG